MQDGPEVTYSLPSAESRDVSIALALGNEKHERYMNIHLSGEWRSLSDITDENIRSMFQKSAHGLHKRTHCLRVIKKGVT